jgi:hypothetical protein
MEKTEELTEILKRLNSGQNPLAVKDQAKEFLDTVDAFDLSVAEQKLIDEGQNTADISKLCSLHLSLLPDQVEKMKGDITSDHVLSMLVSEHETILCLLDDLELINERIQKMRKFDPDCQEFKKLDHIAEQFLAAELHHQREEEILFPALEEKGIYSPPEILREEHDHLRQRKQDLKTLATLARRIDFDDFKERIGPLVTFLAPALRDHIHKENNFLYPTALKVIDSDSVWLELKAECDRIGYCAFVAGK